MKCWRIVLVYARLWAIGGYGCGHIWPFMAAPRERETEREKERERERE